jgi:hypothetical protein
VLRAERLSRAWRALSRLDTRVEKAVWFWARLQEEKERFQTENKGTVRRSEKALGFETLPTSGQDLLQLNVRQNIMRTRGLLGQPA